MIRHEAIGKNCKLVIAHRARNLIKAPVDDRGGQEDTLTLQGAERQRIPMDTDVREVRETVRPIGHMRTRSQTKCRSSNNMDGSDDKGRFEDRPLLIFGDY